MEKYIFKNKNVFQFVMYINNRSNVVCIREFGVFGYNPQNVNTLTNIELMKVLGNTTDSTIPMGIIPKYIKGLSENLLWERFNPYSTVNVFKEEKEENSQYVIEINKMPTKKIGENQFVIDDSKQSKYLIENIGKIGFDASVYQRKLNVDIIPVISNVVKTTIEFLTCDGE